MPKVPKTTKMPKIIALALTACLLFAAPAFAAWTVSETLDKYTPEYLKLHKGAFRIKLACTSDSSSTTYTLVNPDVIGAYFYMVETIPDGSLGPSGTYSVTITNDLGTTVLVANGRSTTAKEIAMASTTIGGFPMLFGTNVTITTLGSGKKTAVYLYYDK